MYFPEYTPYSPCMSTPLIMEALAGWLASDRTVLFSYWKATMLGLHRRVGLAAGINASCWSNSRIAVLSAYCHAAIVTLTSRPVNSPSSDNGRDSTMKRVLYITSRFVDIVVSCGWPPPKLRFWAERRCAIDVVDKQKLSILQFWMLSMDMQPNQTKLLQLPIH